jgi:hypothetical protein
MSDYNEQNLVVNAKAAAKYWFANEPPFADEVALKEYARRAAWDEIHGPGGLAHEFLGIPHSWEKLYQFAFMEEYRRLSES